MTDNDVQQRIEAVIPDLMGDVRTLLVEAAQLGQRASKDHWGGRIISKSLMYRGRDMTVAVTVTIDPWPGEPMPEIPESILEEWAAAEDDDQS